MELVNMSSAEAAIGSAGSALCGVCGQSFSSNSDLQGHMVIHMRERPFECSFCDMRYRNYYDFHCHLKTLHSKRSFRLKIGEIKYSNIDNNVKKVTNNPADAEIHCRVDKTSKKYQCTFCSETFIEQQHLVEHVKQHISDIYNCEYCEKRFTHVELLHNHTKRVHKISVLKKRVEMPPDSSNVETRVDETVNAHPPAETDPILNATIVKVTDTGSILMMEKNDEENIEEVCEGIEVADIHKIVTCTLCSKVFKGKHNYKEHMLTHTGEKPFACVLCDVRFRQRSAISRHLRAAHKEYKGPTYKAIRKVLDSTKAADIRGSHSESLSVKNETSQRGSIYQGYPVSGTGVIINLGDKSAVDRGKLSQAGGRSVVETTRFIGAGNESVVSQGELIHAEDRPIIESGQFTGLSDRSLANHGELIQTDGRSVIETTRFIGPGEKSVAYPRVLAHAGTSVVQAEGFVNNSDRFAVEMDRLVDTGVSEMDNEDDDMGYGLHGHTVEINTMPQCTVCNKTFPYKSLLQEHMLIHSGENPYACVVCEMRFTHRDTVDRHMRTVHGHLGNQVTSKPLSSDSTRAKRIRESFTFSEGVFEKQTVIKLSDSEDNPYIKSVIGGAAADGKALSHKENENDKKGKSSKVWQCSVCGEVRSSGIREHMLSHTSEIPFECDICGKQFRVNRYRRRHMQRVHKVFSSQEAEGRVKGDANEISKSDPDGLSGKQSSGIERRKKRTQKVECPVCNKMILKLTFRRHQERHSSNTDKRPYRCDLCVRRFKTLDSYNVHIMSAHQKCPIHGSDGKSLSGEGNQKPLSLIKLVEPLTASGQDASVETGDVENTQSKPIAGTENTSAVCTCRKDTPTSFPCMYCSKTFPRDSSLRQHIALHKRMAPYECEYCGLRFKRLKSRNVHIGLQHKSSPNGKEPRKASKRKQVKRDGEQKINKCCCTVCGLGCRDISRLREHMVTHSSERPYQCEYCDEFTTKHFRNYRHHVKNIHIGYPLPERPSTKAEKSEKHYVILKSAETVTKQSSSNDKTGESLCVSANDDDVLESKQGNNVDNDKSSETNKCNFCSKTFCNPRYLKQHLRTHTGEKLFKCTLCDMRFFFRASVCSHIKTVHGLYDADSKKIVSKGDRVKRKYGQRKIQTNISYECTVCSKMFSTKYKFDSHMRTHSGHTCPLCQRKFKHSSAYRAHMKRVHAGRSIEPHTFKRWSGSQPDSDDGESMEEKFAEEILLKDLTIKLRRCDSPGYPGANGSKQMRSSHTACTVGETDLNDHNDKTGATDCSVTNFETDPKKRIVDCPVAETEDFDNDLSSAMEEEEADVSCADELSNEGDRVTELFQCTICNKILSQQHHLDEHMLVHTAEQSKVDETLEQNRIEKIVMDNESVGMRMNFQVCLKKEPDDVEESDVIEMRDVGESGTRTECAKKSVIKVEELENFETGDIESNIIGTDSENRECKSVLSHVDRESVALSANITESTCQANNSDESQVPTICQTHSVVVFQKPVVYKIFRCKLCSKIFQDKSLLRSHVLTTHGSSVLPIAPSESETSAVHEDVEVIDGMIDSQSGVRSVKTDNLRTGKDSTHLSYSGVGAGSSEQEDCGSDVENEPSDNESVDLTHKDGVTISRKQRNLRSSVKKEKDDTQRTFKGSVVLAKNDDGSLKYKQTIDAYSRQTSYSCEICNKTFGYQRAFQEHVMFHSGERPYKCDFCDKRFIRQRGCIRHMRFVHTKRRTADGQSDLNDSEEDLSANEGEASKCEEEEEEIKGKAVKGHQCRVCRKDFMGRSKLIEHANVHTGETQQCVYCGKGFVLFSSYQRHVKQKHKGYPMPSKPRGVRKSMPKGSAVPDNLLANEQPLIHADQAPHQCVHCGQRLSRFSCLRKHIKNFHKGHPLPTRDPKQRKDYRAVADPPNRLNVQQCVYCGQFMLLSSYLRHVRRRHKGRPIPSSCLPEESVPVGSDDLSATEGEASKCVQDENNDTETPYLCTICDKTFATQILFQDHVPEHYCYGERPHNSEFTTLFHYCTICGKGFLDKSRLCDHMANHTGDFGHSCIYCGKKFKRFSGYRNHVFRRHKGCPVPTRPRRQNSLHEESTVPNKAVHSDNSDEASDRKEDRKGKSTASELKQRVEAHAEEKPYQCVYCGERFRIFHVYMSHVKYVHKGRPVPKRPRNRPLNLGDDSVAKFITICESERGKELSKNSPLSAEVDDVEGLECDVGSPKDLEKNGEDVLNIKRDIVGGADPVKGEIRNSQQYEDDDNNRDVTDNHKCVICSKTFQSTESLSEHMICHTGTKPYKCVLCEMRFHSQTSAARHVRIVHNGCNENDIGKLKGNERKGKETGEQSDVYKCFFCEQTFQSSGGRKRHVRNIHLRGNVPKKSTTPSMHLCSVCGFMCRTGSRLRSHMLTHTVGKPHECEFCHAKFKLRSSLQTHLKSRNHRGECQTKQTKQKKKDAFKCPVCDKVFPSYSEDRLEKHMRQHTGETPYKCDFCHVRFRYEDSVKKHLKSRSLRGTCPKSYAHARASEKKFTCTVCSKGFVFKQSLADHMTIHTGEKRYRCDYCAERYRTACTLRLHIRKAHKGCPSRVGAEQTVAGNHMSEPVVNTNTFVDNSRYDSGHQPNIEPMEYDDEEDEGPDLWNENDDGGLRYNSADRTIVPLPVAQGQVTNLSLRRDHASVPLSVSHGQVPNVNLGRENTYHVQLPIGQDQLTNLTPTPRRDNTSVHLTINHGQETNFALRKGNTFVHLPIDQSLDTNLNLESENTSAHLPVNQNNLTLKTETTNTFVRVPSDQDKETNITVKRKNAKMTSKDKLIERNAKQNSSPKFAQCNVCGKTFRDSNLPEHMLTHTGERPHKCHLCEQKYRQRSALLRHLKKSHNVVTKREVLYGDKNAGQITEEAVKRKGNKKGGRIASIHQCMFCDRKYMGKEEFKEHVRTHTGEVPYQCDFCLARYRHLGSIRRHLRVRELRGTCPVPHKNLIAEKVGKEGKTEVSKLFQCRLCGQAFNYRIHYWEHMKIHEGENQPELQCDHCGLKFNSVQDLHQHMSSVHQENPVPFEITTGPVDSNNVEKVDGSVTDISLSDNTMGMPGDSKDYSVIAVIDIVDFEDPNQSTIPGSEHCVTDLKQL